MQSVLVSADVTIVTPVQDVVEVPQLVGNSSVIDLVLGAGPVVFGVLILLVVMSVATWGICLSKWMEIAKAKRQSRKFSDVFWGKNNSSKFSKLASA